MNLDIKTLIKNKTSRERREVFDKWYKPVNSNISGLRHSLAEFFR